MTWWRRRKYAFGLDNDCFFSLKENNEGGNEKVKVKEAELQNHKSRCTDISRAFELGGGHFILGP